MDGHPPKRCGGTPESSRLPPPQLGGRRATHFSFRNQPRRSTAVFCQANQKRFSFQVRLTALPKEARGTSPFDGDGHEALESVARHRVRRGTPPPHSALRLALDGDVQRGRLGLPFLRYPLAQTFAHPASNFLASIVSGAMFRLFFFLKFGPIDAWSFLAITGFPST